MTDRDELKNYPCPYARGNGGREDWGKECQTEDDACFLRHACAALPIYRAHIALRDDMRKLRAAVLGEMTAAEAAEMYREAQSSCDYWGGTDAGDHMTKLADVVAKL